MTLWLMSVTRSHHGLMLAQPRVLAGRGDQVLHDLRGDGVRSRSRCLGGGVLRFHLFLLLCLNALMFEEGKMQGYIFCQILGLEK